MVHVCCDGFDSAKFHSSRGKVLSSFLPADFSMLLFGGAAQAPVRQHCEMPSTFARQDHTIFSHSCLILLASSQEFKLRACT